VVARRAVLASYTVKTVANRDGSQGNLVGSEGDRVYGNEEGHNSRNERDRREATMGE
jgi:hypothetical protein